jgi:hypothetical protein
VRCSATVVVVEHPDDEALWLSSVVASASRVVFCFGAVFERPQLSEARRRAVAALPLADIVDLAIPESGAGFSIGAISGLFIVVTDVFGAVLEESDSNEQSARCTDGATGTRYSTADQVGTVPTAP